MLPGWTRTEIAGIPARAFDPGLGARPFGLIWLHDESAESPADNTILAAALRDQMLPCVAPEGGESWWLDRVCPAFHLTQSAEQHLLANVIPWVQAGGRVFAVAGVGMGGQGAVRLGLRHPKVVPVVASAAGAFDFHERYGAGTALDELYPSREYARQDTAILHVQPHDWPPHIWFACPPGHEWYRGNDRLHEKLAAIGVPHVADLDTPGTPEDLVAPMLAWVVAALERESRRIL
jgi:S-formylglutathione hydrolase